MQLIRSVLVICILALAVNTGFAQEDGTTIQKDSFQEVLTQEALRQEAMTQDAELTTMRNSNRYLYLLGSIGYSADMFSALGYGGIAANITGGWQANKYFALEIGIGYSQAYYHTMDLKVFALYQPNIKLTNSITIMPKVGLGFAYMPRFGLTEDYGNYYYYLGYDFMTRHEFGILGTLGVRVNFGRFIAGVSYENNFLNVFSEYKFLAEFGVKF